MKLGTYRDNLLWRRTANAVRHLLVELSYR